MARDLGRRTVRRFQQAPPTTVPPTTTTGTVPTEPPSGPVDITQAIEDVLAGAGGGGTTGPQPIGVGPGFQVRQPYTQTTQRRGGFDLGGGPGPRTVGPRYFADDEYAPANWQQNIIAKLQRDLASIGMFDTNATLIPGDWGEESASAFRRLLAYANQHGIPWQVALSNIRAQLQGSSTSGEGTGGRFRVDENGNIVPADTPDRAPLVTSTTDPRTLNILFRETSMNLMGQALSQDQITDMTADYNQMEVQRQQEAYNAGVEGGSVVDIQAPEAFIQSELESRFPNEVAANRGMELLNQSMGFLASPAWGIS